MHPRDQDPAPPLPPPLLCAGILSDLFPGVALPDIDYTDIKAYLSECAVRVGLQPLPSFLEKAIQLYEMIIVRHGLMLVCVWGWGGGQGFPGEGHPVSCTDVATNQPTNQPTYLPT